MAQVIRRYDLTITTTGSAGSATGNSVTPPISGFLLGAYFNFHASSPATTDTTVTDVATGRTLLTLTDTATDVMHLLNKQTSDNTGTAISGAYGYQPIDGEVKVALAGCDALTGALVASLYFLVG